MYTTIGGSVNGTSYISGDFGKYQDSKDYSFDYGRNSVNNYKQYLSNYSQPRPTVPKLNGLLALSDDEFDNEMSKFDDFIYQSDLNIYKMPPLNFVQQYMPGEIKSDKINKTALLAASYEELGKKEVSVEEFNSMLQSDNNNNSEIVSANALDLNKDGMIDIAEYSTSILLEDALSPDSEMPSYENIDGIITKSGSNKMRRFATSKNQKIAYRTYSCLYDYYELGKAKDEFLKKFGDKLD